MVEYFRIVFIAVVCLTLGQSVTSISCRAGSDPVRQEGQADSDFPELHQFGLV
jgi:hypothetical protein